MEKPRDVELDDTPEQDGYNEDQRKVDPTKTTPTKAIGNMFKKVGKNSANAELNHRVAHLNKIMKQKARNKAAKASRRKNRK